MISKKNNLVGILNFHYSDHNYGAVLQAAALADVLVKNGFEVEHIDFIPKCLNKKSNVFGFLKSKFSASFKDQIKRLFGIKVYFKPNVVGSEVFEQFREQWIVRSSCKFYSARQLDSIGDKYFSVIVGSDQVWRPSMYINKHEDVYAYFLSFLPSNVKRISYSASFGVEQWEELHDTKLTATIKDSLSKFNAISVREVSGVEICKNIFDVFSQHVLDPTLLNGRHFFDRVILNDNVIMQGGNIVYYKLDVDDSFMEEMKAIGLSMQSMVEDIYYKKLRDDLYKYIPVSEWLAKIRDSKLVVTDSFHCVCLSILFNKEFVCYPNKNRGMGRMKSLLESLGISGRLYDGCVPLSSFIESSNKINYSTVNDKLEKLRISSMDYLLGSLLYDEN